jgi:hypothetical protein
VTAYVYVVGPHGSQHAEDLRYSLRTIERYGSPSAVFIAGWAPPWVEPDALAGYIEGPILSDANASSTANLLAACRDPRVPDDFVFMHDDMYLLRPVDRVPVAHAGALTSDTHVPILRDTYRLLRTKTPLELYNYELHRPLPVRKTLMREALELAEGRRVAKRTLYGNLAGIGGSEAFDVKVRQPDGEWDRGDWCVSSYHSTLPGRLGEWLREEFPGPSCWERPWMSRRERTAQRRAARLKNLNSN